MGPEQLDIHRQRMDLGLSHPLGQGLLGLIIKRKAVKLLGRTYESIVGV